MGNEKKACKLIYHSLRSSGYQCSLEDDGRQVVIGFAGDSFSFDKVVIAIRFNEDLSGSLLAEGILEVADVESGKMLAECNKANLVLRNVKFYLSERMGLCCRLDIPYAPFKVEEAYLNALGGIVRAIDLTYRRFAAARTSDDALAGPQCPDRPSLSSGETLEFVAVDEEGRTIRCHALFLFEHEGRNLIVYTDDSEDEEGNTRVYASQYNPTDLDSSGKGEFCTLPMAPIDHDSDWRAIEALLEELQGGA